MVQQIRRIIDFLSLREIVVPFSRCLVCNSPLMKVTKKSVWERIPPKARSFYDDYSSCSMCGRIYWQGGHFAGIKKLVDEILAG
jgi:uncharacterized protein with PIN domain